MRVLGTLAAALLAAAPTLLLSGATSPPPASAATPQRADHTCRSGAHAVIAGSHVCLKVGQRCRRRLDRQYHRYGFHCHTGRLIRRTTVSPPALPTGASVTATIPISGAAGKSAVAGGSLWVRETDTDMVSRIDIATNQVQARIRVGLGDIDSGIAAGDESVWVASADDSVSRIDPQTNQVTARVSLPDDTLPEGVGTTPGAVWVAAHHRGSVVRIDTASNTIAAILRVSADGTGGPQSLGVGAGSVWVGVPNRSSVFRIDPGTTGVAATIEPGLFPCGGVAAGDDAIWVAASCQTPAVIRIDPVTNAVVAKIFVTQVAPNAGDVAVGLGAVWVRTPLGLLRIDPATNRVVGMLRGVGIAGNRGISVGEGAVWLSDGNRVLRILPTPSGSTP